jgi:leucyl-tRNA synthetase
MEFILDEKKKYIVGRVEKCRNQIQCVTQMLFAQNTVRYLRLYEMFLGPLEQAKPWNTAGISGVLVS